MLNMASHFLFGMGGDFVLVWLPYELCFPKR